MLSSTVKDLRPDRYAVLSAFAGVPFVDVIGAEPIRSATHARSSYVTTVEMARDCHLYLLILGGRYGFEARDGKSATELEFDEAYRTDPTKILVIRKEGVRTDAKQKRLIRRIGAYETGYWLTKYRSPDELNDLVLTSFRLWLEDRLGDGRSLTYFDQFVRMAIQRKPTPDSHLLYSVTEEDIELHYTAFGQEHQIHIQKAQIYGDFWGSLADLDRQIEGWKDDRDA